MIDRFMKQFELSTTPLSPTAGLLSAVNFDTGTPAAPNYCTGRPAASNTGTELPAASMPFSATSATDTQDPSCVAPAWKV